MAAKTLAKVANLPTSPKEIIFQDSASKEKQDNVGKAAVSSSQQAGDEAEKEIIPKEFFWDQLVTYIATAIALLTLVDTTLQFFRTTGGLVCYIPEELILDETRDQAAYVNNFCQESLSTSEYYSVFILIQGILIVAPHYLWSSIFSGQFDFFFDLVRQIDRLRDSKTGEYRTKNFEILKKLENEFPERRKLIGMFVLYISKLALQFIIIVISLLANISIFPEHGFQFVFDCPAELTDSNSESSGGFSQSYYGWRLPEPVQCVYSSFRILSKVQYVDYMLLVLALGAVSYGLFWCFKRHTSGLGYGEIATFAFTSCLSPSEFVFDRSFLLPPRVGNDLDFLLMRLFRADSGHGRVFKDLQVDKELKRLVSEDHELLHLTGSIIQDRNEAKIKSKTNRNPGEVSDHRMKDIMDAYRVAKFGENPDYLVYARMGELGILGDMEITQEEHEQVKSIRNQFFGFLRFTSEEYTLAYDISFGTIGFALILARAFKKVVSVNFHPFYQNEKEVCKKEVFHANYSRLTIPNDIFSKSTPNVNKFDEALDQEFLQPHRPVGDFSLRPANVIVVGPFTDEAKKATVNLHIQRLYTGEYFAKGASLLAIRPLRIAFKDVSNHFCQYKPPRDLFEPVPIKGQCEGSGDTLKWVQVGTHTGIEVTCGDTRCIFEFKLYKFACEYLPEFQPPPPRSSSSTSSHSHGTPDNDSTEPQKILAPSKVHNNAEQLNSHQSTAINSNSSQGNSQRDRIQPVNGINSQPEATQPDSALNSHHEIVINTEPDIAINSQQQQGTIMNFQLQQDALHSQQNSLQSLQLDSNVPSSQQSSCQSLQQEQEFDAGLRSQRTCVSLYSDNQSSTGNSLQVNSQLSSSQSLVRDTEANPSHHLSSRSMQHVASRPQTEPLKRKTAYKFNLQPLSAQHRAGFKLSLPSLSLPLVSNGSAPPVVSEDSCSHHDPPSSSDAQPLPKSLKE